MDENDDDSKEFSDGYDENLMGDEEDRRKLAQMTEKEREQELFNRGERRETLKIRFEIERKLRTKAKKRELEKKQGKPVRGRKRLKASEIYSSDDESSDASSDYVPDVDKTSTPNETSTGTKSAKMNTRASSTLLDSSSSPSASSASSESSSSDSEPERDDLDADEDSRTAQDDFQMTLADLKCLQLKRDKIEQWIYAPFFNETAIGLFAKISVGQSPQTHQPMYKVAYIVDITKGPTSYYLDHERMKERTDKQCLVRIGGVVRTYKMSFISNRSFDEEDYNKWRAYIDQEGHGMPTREHFMRKKRDLLRANNYEYKDEDIAYEINERSRFNETPFNFAKKKTELMGEKADAEAQNDFEKARELQQRIDELEERAKQLEKSRSSSTFSAISFMNERNRIKNIEESERVLKESKSVKTEDPFTRRKCTPTIVHNKNNSTANGASDKSSQDAANKANQGASSATNGTQKAANESVNDLFQAHSAIDLQIDIDI